MFDGIGLLDPDVLPDAAGRRLRTSDHVEQALACLGIGGTLGQEVLRADDLSRLGKQDRSTARNQKVHGIAERGIAANP